MRGILHSFAIWLGVLQIPVASQPPLSIANAGQLLGVAGALASLTVMVYRLGVWRQEMYNTKHDVGAEVARYREETGRNFERLERRFTTFDQFIAAASEQRVVTERWQSRVDTKLEGHEREIATVTERLGRLEGEGEGGV
jgi:hypothetical protein